MFRSATVLASTSKHVNGSPSKHESLHSDVVSCDNVHHHVKNVYRSLKCVQESKSIGLGINFYIHTHWVQIYYCYNRVVLLLTASVAERVRVWMVTRRELML